MKVLMLILASDTSPIYIQLQESWKRFMKSHPQIDCWFYKCDPEQKDLYEFRDEYTVSVKCKDGLEHLYTKFILALRAFEYRLSEYAYICRPNESSFFIFDRYLKFLEDKPRTNVGFGVIGKYYDITFLSGAGFTLSRDVVERMLLLDQKDYIVDDVTVGIVLKTLEVQLIKHDRFLMNSQEKHKFISEIEEDSTIFHIRCKHDYPYPTRRDLDVFIHNRLGDIFNKT